MVNELRAFARLGGGFLTSFAVWAGWQYADGPAATAPFLAVAALGLVVAYTPAAVTRAKHWLTLTEQHWAARRGANERTTPTFVSDPVGDSEAALAAVRDAVRDGDEYDGVTTDSFPEGGGLTVTHTEFHNSFVRVAESGRLVVTGASKRTRALAQLVESVCDVPVESRVTNPLSSPEKVRGAPRVFLGLVLAVVVVAGVVGVAGAGYPSGAYNPAEKLVLVSFDARSDLPGVSTTETRLDKAAFLVTVLDEKAVEMRWSGNDTDRVTTHARESLAIRREAASLLGKIRQSSPTPAQVRRAERIERDLVAAERRVASSIDDALDGELGESAERELVRIRERLRERANATNPADSTLPDESMNVPNGDDSTPVHGPSARLLHFDSDSYSG
jgi:hypothetical protein